MVCPNCGRISAEDALFCIECRTPLSNAHYVVAEKKSGKGIFKFVLFLLLLSLLSVGAYTSYLYYIKYVEKQCLGLTEEYMKSENAEMKQAIDERLKETSFNEEMEKKLSKLEIEMDEDGIYQQIMKHADYKIDEIKTYPLKCVIQMTSSNLSYDEVNHTLTADLTQLYENVLEEERKEAEKSSRGWWSNFSEWISDVTKEGHDPDNPKEKTACSDDLQLKSYSQWMQKYEDDIESKKVTGSLTFEWKDGKWKLTNIDPALIYNYYGMG